MKFIPLLLLLVSCRNDIVFDSSKTITHLSANQVATMNVFWRITVSKEHIYFGEPGDTITREAIFSRRELPGSLRFKTNSAEYIVWYKYGAVESIYTKPKFGLPRTYLK